MNKKNIDINRLRKAQNSLNDIEFVNKDLERQKQEREQAKKEIIKKASSKFVDDGRPDPSVTQSIKPLNNVKVVKTQQANILHNQKVKDTQERLSYTLQMEPISKNQVNSYRKKRVRNEQAYLDGKFAHLNSSIMRIYLITIIALLFLIAIALLITFNIKGE